MLYKQHFSPPKTPTGSMHTRLTRPSDHVHHCGPNRVETVPAQDTLPFTVQFIKVTSLARAFVARLQHSLLQQVLPRTEPRDISRPSRQQHLTPTRAPRASAAPTRPCHIPLCRTDCRVQ